MKLNDLIAWQEARETASDNNNSNNSSSSDGKKITINNISPDQKWKCFTKTGSLLVFGCPNEWQQHNSHNYFVESRASERERTNEWEEKNEEFQLNLSPLSSPPPPMPTSTMNNNCVRCVNASRLCHKQSNEFLFFLHDAWNSIPALISRPEKKDCFFFVCLLAFLRHCKYKPLQF